MKLILDLDTHRCSACGACAIACMDQNDIDPRETAPFRSAFCVETCTGEGDKRTYLSMACMHCADAPLRPGLPLRLHHQGPGDRLHPL